MVKYGFFLSLLLFLCACAQSQSSTPVLTTFSTADGLSVNNVNNVHADPNGFIWIATNNGLNKFDGSRFTRFYASHSQQNSGLSGNIIKQVLCDSLLVWSAINNNGLSYYFEEIDYFYTYRHDPSNPASLVSNAINCLLLSTDKKIYVGTDSGLSIFNRNDSRFHNITRHPFLKKKLNITSLDQSDDGVVWIGTYQQGLLYYNSKKEIQLVSHLPPEIKSSVINDLLFDENKNEIWLATTRGVWCGKRNVDGSISQWSQPFASIKRQSIECMRNDIDGNLWVGTSGNGVYWYDSKATEHHFTYPLNSKHINDIFCSVDGSVWISTPNGLQVYNERLQSFPVVHLKAEDDPQNTAVVAGGICLYKNYLFATTDNYISIMDTNYSKSYKLSLTDKNKQPVHFINISLVGNCIMATGSDGVYQVELINEKAKLVRPRKLKHFSSYIRKPCSEIIQVNDSVFWLAGDNNCIYIMNTKSRTTDTLSLYKRTTETQESLKVINRLYKDREGRILVGSNNSMASYTASGKELQFVSLAKNNYPKQPNPVNDIYDDGTFIWVATNGGGLLICSRSLAVLNELTTENGLSNNTVYCIQPGTKNKLWLTTNRGLSVYDTEQKKFTNYYQNQGLPSHEFKAFGKASYNDRTLYFSSSAGIIQVRPYAWPVTDASPLHTMITKVMIGNEIQGKGELALLNTRRSLAGEYGKSIVLSFAPVSFFSSTDCILQYKLDDNNQWLDLIPGSEVVLTGLSPGGHKIYARSIIMPENRIGDPLTLSIIINPAYYQQWWFITLIVAIMAAVVYSIYTYRVNQLKKVETLRTKISQDLHDNVGAALSSISIYSQAAIQKNEIGNIIDSNNILRRIGETSREVMSELNDTVWLINPANDNLQKVIQRITKYALPLCSTKGIHFEVKAGILPENFRISLEKRKAIYMLLKEAVNNCVKYAEAKNLDIRFEQQQKALKISIKDDGIGINENDSSSGNGLTNMKQRTKNVNGKININSILHLGTEITLQLPLTNIDD